VLVEDRREGREHREFEEAEPSYSFDIAIGSGCIDSFCMETVLLSKIQFQPVPNHFQRLWPCARPQETDPGVCRFLKRVIFAG
jgi:hypothetical protein